MGIAEAIAAVRTAWGAAESALEARDTIKLNEVKITMSNQLLELYTAAFALAEAKEAYASRTRDLENEVIELRKKADKLGQYERVRTPVGAIVFVETATKNAPDGPVYACALCMDESKISTLQPGPKNIYLTCARHGKIGFNQHPWPSGGVGVLARME